MDSGGSDVVSRADADGSPRLLVSGILWTAKIGGFAVSLCYAGGDDVNAGRKISRILSADGGVRWICNEE